MKSIICLTILAFAIACVSACDPLSDNQPTCTAANINEPTRNFWNPTLYWLCSAPGATANSIMCPIGEGFDSVSGTCVPFITWVWTVPCA